MIDATNPLEYPGDGSVRLAFGFDDSLGERVQRKLPESMVVKTFNMVGNPYMIDPDLPGGPPTMLICGNAADAKATVSESRVGFGWEAADLGQIERSRALEEVAMPGSPTARSGAPGTTPSRCFTRERPARHGRRRASRIRGAFHGDVRRYGLD